MSDAATSPSATVLLSDDDSFERHYVLDVLAARGIRVLGPFADPRAALAAVAVTPPDAAVVAWSGDQAAGGQLLDELARRGIPCLTLAHDPMSVTDTRARLTRPFAAFQVAEWVADAFGARRALDEADRAPAAAQPASAT